MTGESGKLKKRKQIYFARSLRGDRTEGDQAVHETIVRVIRGQGCQVAFETPHGLSKIDIAPDEYIYKRDIAWLNESQAMVAEVSNASTGVGYEIAYAKYVRQIPILYIAKKDSQVSAMITGSAQVFYYDTSEDLRVALAAFIAALKE